MKVCYFGTYRAEYSRNRIMIEGLRRNGVEVIECHIQLWHSIEDRVQAVSGGWMNPQFWGRVLKTYIRLVRQFILIGRNYDVLVVGYPGQFDVYLARLLTWLHGKPLVWDIFMSIYLISLERELDRTSPLAVGVLRLLERLACRLPDRLVIDTQEYANWFERTHGIAATRFRLVPTGADSTQFSPRSRPARPQGKFVIVYHGTFIPNHGVPIMVEAAKQVMDDEEIHFLFIGDGPERSKVEKMVEGYRLPNVSLVDWLATDALLEEIAGADLCLGVFGTTPQSLMTVQNKIYEGMALAKPVLTGDGPAVKQSLQHGKHVYLCDRANPQSLAQAIRYLKANPGLRDGLSAQGNAFFASHFTVEQLGSKFADILRESIDRNT